MRIVFMGTPSYATEILKALCAEQTMDVALVVTQEDKPVGRKQILTPPDVKAWLLAEQSPIEVYQPKTLKSEEAREKIASSKPDFIVVAAYGQILPKAILDIAPCINLHASLLPKYRGASPIQSTLLANESYAGVTSMLMEEGLDTGAMLAWSYYHLQKEDTSASLFVKLSHMAAQLTIQTLMHFDTLSPLTQISANASHCKKIKKEDGLIHFDKPAKDIMCYYRAFFPWPGVYIASGLKLLVMEETNTFKEASVGKILEISQNGVLVGCQEGSLLLKMVQPASKNAMSALDYIRGKRLNIGDSLV